MSDESHTLLELTTLLLRRRRLVIGLPLVAMVSALALSFFLPKRFTVEARFVPESNSPSVSRIAGLAAQFGVDVPGVEAGESIDFYAELLKSTELLRSAVLTNYRFQAPNGDTLSGDLVQLLDVDGDTRVDQVHNAVKKLDDLVVSHLYPSAEIVSVETSAPWPALAVDISSRLLALINEFNLERRQSRASAERAFLETRSAEARDELHRAEAELERFMRENRQYDESPQLRFEAGRLQRNVDLHQQIYTSLASAFEQARVDEVRNTPVITVIDQPRPPAEQTAPKYLLNAVLGLALGFLVALGVVIGGAMLRSVRQQNPAQFAELEAATRASIDDVRPSRFMGRLRGRSGGNGRTGRERPQAPDAGSDDGASDRTHAGRAG